MAFLLYSPLPVIDGNIVSIVCVHQRFCAGPAKDKKATDTSPALPVSDYEDYDPEMLPPGLISTPPGFGASEDKQHSSEVRISMDSFSANELLWDKDQKLWAGFVTCTRIRMIAESNILHWSHKSKKIYTKKSIFSSWVFWTLCQSQAYCENRHTESSMPFQQRLMTGPSGF